MDAYISDISYSPQELVQPLGAMDNCKHCYHSSINKYFEIALSIALNSWAAKCQTL